MPRSTPKTLAGGAVTAARKVIARKPKGDAEPEESTAATPAKKATATAKKATSTAKKAAAPAAKKATTTAKKAAAPAAKKATSTAKKAASTAKKATPKKAAPKKVTPATLVVKEGEEAWTKAELDEVVKELNSHAARLRQELHDQEEELAGLLKDAGDGAGHDQADMGATSFERDHELTVVNNSREMLAQTERALARIADGTYGVCESCGQPIGKLRVMAFPRATLCMECKKREERR